MLQKPENVEAIDSLWVGLYPELKRLAHSRLRRSGPHTLLDTTGLVNDAYLRVAGAAALRDASPGQFMAYAARAMRSVVIDLVRERRALRHGGDLQRMTLDTELLDIITTDDEPLTVQEVLTELVTVDERLSQVVEMRYFGGFTDIEIANALGTSERTVRRDWEKARLLMRTMLTE